MIRKTISAALLASIMLLSACNTETKKEVSSENIPQENAVIETTSVAEVENPSDKYFMEALDKFDMNKAEATKNFEEGITAYKQETNQYTGKDKQMTDAAIKNLEKMCMKMKNGKVKNVDMLDDAISKAESASAHTYFVSLEDDLIQPVDNNETESKVSSSVDKLKKVVAKDHSSLKAEGEKLVKMGDSIDERLKKNEQVGKKEIENFASRSKTWIEEHI